MKQRKGYIGRSMSINAKKAREKGLLPASYWTSDVLKQHGFNYPVSFFRWLCKRQYITAKEYHHTGCAFKCTGYYQESTISYVVQRYDLDLLYEIYTGKIDKNEAKKKKKITYVKVKTTDRILGLKGLNTVTLNCVRYSNIIWYSKNKFIHEDSKDCTIIAEYDERPFGFENKNIFRLVQFLLTYKANYAYAIANKENYNLLGK